MSMLFAKAIAEADEKKKCNKKANKSEESDIQ